jgi:cysteine protease ATG4
MNEFERVGRNVLRTFYDPLPSNDSNDPIWCLGTRYDSRPPPPKPAAPETSNPPNSTASPPPADRTANTEDDSWIQTPVDEADRKESPNGEDPNQYGNWPHAFLDDFESRIWMTYRSGFAPIQKSQDPKATAAMSFRVRMQNLAQSAFSSDSGFGCMIRSGQCIVANALLELRMGRGKEMLLREHGCLGCVLILLCRMEETGINAREE